MMRTGTDIRSLLGIEHPIVQAPMAGVQDAQLAVAISNAGGLGSLPCAMLSADALQRELRRLVAATNKPYNLKSVEVSDADRQTIKDAVATVSFPAFAELCDASAPGCSEEWKKAVGSRFGM